MKKLMRQMRAGLLPGFETAHGFEDFNTERKLEKNQNKRRLSDPAPFSKDHRKSHHYPY